MPEPVKRIVRASDAVMAAWRPGAAWDLTDEVRAAAAEARAAGVPNVLVILSADGCHGCGILEDQLKREGAALAGKA
ncbi:MAG: hypothetical protein K8I02_11930, partial [Candidatus Methylomirabilis sp.]|nr:hypothetical protein [Deltaproteobacteria bacterium]